MMDSDNNTMKVAVYFLQSKGDRKKQNTIINTIKANPDLKYVDAYIDYVDCKKDIIYRDGMIKMIRDAEVGMMDYIITDSICCFAPSVSDCLYIIERLKQKGVGIFFDVERIDSFDSNGECLLEYVKTLNYKQNGISCFVGKRIEKTLISVMEGKTSDGI